tara:strand:+ start:1186 stop:1785 length:600 start_codon:yes stop_codon:yes gene_type:complete
MKKIIKYIIFAHLILSCSKSNNALTEIEIIEQEIEQIYSCVNYDELLDPKNTNQDDLMQYWYKFVNDVKCTRGGPDYGERNKSPNIFFEYRTVAQIASGVTADHIAYSTFSGYCNDSAVNVGVLYDEWTEKNLLQRIWIMYHEFGHDVYKYEHSTDRADIMFPSSTRSDININDFIEAKDRMFRKSFPGIRYIPCPSQS